MTIARIIVGTELEATQSSGTYKFHLKHTMVEFADGEKLILPYSMKKQYRKDKAALIRPLTIADVTRVAETHVSNQLKKLDTFEEVFAAHALRHAAYSMPLNQYILHHAHAKTAAVIQEKCKMQERAKAFTDRDIDVVKRQYLELMRNLRIEDR